MRENELIKVYDEMFNLISTERRSVVHRNGLLHQVVHLWIYEKINGEKWLYFIQRAFDLPEFPGLYDLPASGHIDPEGTFSQALVAAGAKQLGLELAPEHLNHIGNVRQVMDKGDYHDNAFCQVYIKKVHHPEFTPHHVADVIRVKYTDYAQWIKDPEQPLTIYSMDGKELKQTTAKDWWYPRKEEFEQVIEPYFETK